ncbi:hypothetical protein C0995_014666 [Termitomyces sp. Mi166|nr:hypothetical protein C0995_014666 [Termitomyces sp. Mi166\
MVRRSARLASARPSAVGSDVSAESPNSDAASDNHEDWPEIDSDRSDEEDARPKKRQKRSKSKKSSAHSSLQFKNVRGRRGALKDIVEMPLDVLHEIFMYLTPIEVLSLSRLCKTLRRILMTKSAECIWKQARLNLDDFPDCPNDLNEAQFANLVFGAHCDNIKNVARWIIRHSKLGYRKERMKENVEFLSHGRLCEKWLEKQDDKRAAQLEEIRQRRYEAIKQRLTDLGWGKELETIRGMRNWPSVKQPKDLTDRIWQNIKNDIIDKLEEHRVYRSEQDYLAAQHNRKILLNKRLRNLQQQNPGKVICPDIFALESVEQISALIKAPAEETVEFPESLIFELVQNWRQSCDTEARNMIIAGSSPNSKPNAVDPLSLATTWFRCWKRCSPLQYPEILQHSCAILMSYNEQCLWNADGKRVFFDNKLFTLAKTILEASGLDPETTTRDDVQWPDFYIECYECPATNLNDGKRLLMTWPTALEHALLHHRSDEHPRMAHADLSDTELKRVQEVAAKRLSLWSYNEDFLCVRCEESFVGSWYRLRRHINEDHKKDEEPGEPVYSTDYVMKINPSGFRRQPEGLLILEPRDD